MKNFIYLFLFCLVLLVFSACKNNIMDLKPLDSYSDQTVWSDPNLVQTFVNQQYQVLPNFGWQNSTLNLADLSGDAYCRFDYITASIENRGEVSPANEIGASGDNVWANYWNTIRNCNIFFSKIKSVPDNGDPAMIKRMYGEMRFLRAWSYFSLIIRYGGVPIITKVFGLHSNFSAKRNTYDECVNFIVAQLDSAANELPDTYSNSNDIGRATKGAALALKSRVLLYDASALNNPTNDMSKWKKAADAAKAVMDMSGYHLYQGSDYANIFLNNWNSGIIFEREESKNGGQYGEFNNIELIEAPSGYGGWGANSPSQNLVNAFPMKNGKPITDPNSGYDPKHPYKNRDPRFYADIVYNNEMFYGRKTEFYKGGKDSPQGIDNWNATLTGYTLKKFFDQSHLLSSPDNSNVNFPIFRLAEIYLNYAEAEYHLGNESEARNVINALRERPSVNLPDLSSSLAGPSLLAAIRNERRLDLCFEGQHFWDLLRWKTAMVDLNGSLNGVSITQNTDTTYTYSYQQVIPLKFVPKMYLFPIPLSEMQKVDSTAFKQNPGY